MVMRTPSTSFSSKEQRKNNEESYGNMDNIIMKLDLFNKNVMGDHPNMVKFISSKCIKAYDDE